MRIVLFGLALTLGACTSTYHEYHPVSVTHVVTAGSGGVAVQEPELEPYAILVPPDAR